MRYAASPNALRRRTVLFQYGGSRLGERRSTGNVGRLAERGKEADDADWLGHHGDELHPALAGWAREDIGAEGPAEKKMPVDAARHGKELAVSSIRHQGATVMLVGITTSGAGDSSDAAGGAGASFSASFGALACSRFGAFASSHAFFFASRVPPAGGFGVTRGRKVERAANTPW
jgi:hypothetical protein